MSKLNALASFYYGNHLDRWTGLRHRQPQQFKLAEGFYRQTLRPDYEELLERLLAALEAESRPVVTTVLERWRYLFTHNLLQCRHLFSAEEIARQPEQERVVSEEAERLGLKPNQSEASVLYYHHGLRHTSVAEQLRPGIEGRTVIDVGACLGDSAFVFEKYYAATAVHSFEPMPHNLRWLERLKVTQGLDAMHLVPGVLGRDNQPWPDGTRCQTLDTYVAAHGIEVGAIKMDVEGAEADVLAGARETIRNCKPVLIVSMYHHAEQFHGLQPLIAGMREDYRFAVRKLDNNNPVYETTLFCY